MGWQLYAALACIGFFLLAGGRRAKKKSKNGKFLLTAIIAGAALAVAGGGGTVRAITSGHGRVHGGNLSCAGLESLWEAAGGQSSTAFLAAEVARAESGGRQYATNHNNDGSTDIGYWQINTVHGSLATYDAYGNARAAVELSSNGTDWHIWVTYKKGAEVGQC